MQNNSSDTFESSKKTHIPQGNNFFLSGGSISEQKTTAEIKKRVNDYDSNLLRESAYNDIGDDVLKLEYKIAKMENELNELDTQIKSAEEIRDFNLIQSLLQRKKSAKDNYDTLCKIYKEKSFSAKITESFSSKLSKIFGIDILMNKLLSVNEKIIAVLPKNIASIIEVKKAMVKLEGINKSVDELMKLNIPYGENSERYRQLSSYIIKANSIHSEISGYVRKK